MGETVKNLFSDMIDSKQTPTNSLISQLYSAFVGISYTDIASMKLNLTNQLNEPVECFRYDKLFPFYIFDCVSNILEHIKQIPSLLNKSLMIRCIVNR